MWEFNHRFGPLFLRKDGEPLINQPKSESHLAWEAFETWDLPKQIVNAPPVKRGASRLGHGFSGLNKKEK